MKILIDTMQCPCRTLNDECSISGHECYKDDICSSCPLVRNGGIKFPEGHGDIVDIKHLIDMFWDGNSMEITKDDLSIIKPIIEADVKGTSDKPEPDDIPNDWVATGWTFVDDKLPKEGLDVLLLFENFFTERVGHYRIDEEPYAEGRADMSGWYDEDEEFICSTNSVLAWMPLPTINCWPSKTPSKKEVEL